MINDEANNCYYFAIQNLSELNYLERLQCKKEVMINNNNNNNNNNFQNDLDDPLIYQTVGSNFLKNIKIKALY